MDKPPKKSEDDAYDIWGTAAEDESKARLARRAAHIPAPKSALPTHAESYNPPAEYLFTEAEEKRWRESEPHQRRLDFLPKK